MKEPLENKEELKILDGFLRIISEKNRLFILQLLKNEEMCVCEIWGALNLSQSLISNHLKILKDFGLINSRREGKKIIYSSNKENIKKYLSLFTRLII